MMTMPRSYLLYNSFMCARDKAEVAGTLWLRLESAPRSHENNVSRYSFTQKKPQRRLHFTKFPSLEWQAHNCPLFTIHERSCAVIDSIYGLSKILLLFLVLTLDNVECQSVNSLHSRRGDPVESGQTLHTTQAPKWKSLFWHTAAWRPSNYRPYVEPLPAKSSSLTVAAASHLEIRAC